VTLVSQRARLTAWRRERSRLPREAWVLIAANAVAALGYGVVSPVLPAFARTFGVSLGAVTFSITIFSVMRLFSAPPTGGYQPLEWPDAYWPKSPAPPTAKAWDESIATIHSDLKKFLTLIESPNADFFKPFRWGDGQNLLREALLLADHTAYHLGELIVLRRLLGAWHK